jgi:type IV secretory pathway VirD2 relaxase
MQNRQVARHALDLAPTHIRYKKYQPLTLRKTASSGGSYFASNGIFSLLANRNQRCIVKISYTKNTKTRSWAAHGEYLQREHAQTTGEKGLGFDPHSDTVDLRSMLHQWQQENDEHVFRVIVSPENGHLLDLKQHAKNLMQIVENDFKTKLQWMAIDHHDTDHPHLHILIRGIDERGKTLVIEKDYLTHGFRHQSEELATQVLGLRLNRDIVQTRTRQLEREYVTELDRNILRKAENSIVSYNTPASDNLLSREHRLLEIGRLKFLENMGLAEKISAKAWKLSNNLELALHERQLSNAIIKSRARHNIYTLTHEMPIPTLIHERKPLTGKVVGMGLENELKDQRYLLLEGIDGKVHYLEASNSIVKARDNFEFSNNDIITLEMKKFTYEDGKTIEYVKVQNHNALHTLEKAPYSCLDQDVIKLVKTHAIRPLQQYPEESFAYEYANAMQKRFDELERENVFTKVDNYYRFTHDWEAKLGKLNRKRQLELNHQIEINKAEQSHERKNTLILDTEERRMSSRSHELQRSTS